MNEFWMVWNEGNKAPTVKHNTEQMARDEAERLAHLNPGSVFHVLEAVDSCTERHVTWESGWVNVPF
jgi:hypothetical protein